MTSENHPIHYIISPEIFSRFPEYVRGIVLAKTVSNYPSPKELVNLLREAEAEVLSALNSQDLTTVPQIAAWREAYRTLGIKPSEFRPSMEAMIRRVLNGHELPSINALVDIGNIVSLRHLLPVGGHAMDNLSADITLKAASGREFFTAFGSDQIEHPEVGEFIFCEGDTVLTRRWTWRQSNHTLTTLDTKEIEFNVDALPPVSAADTENACREIVELVRKFCGGDTSIHLLSRHRPRVRVR